MPFRKELAPWETRYNSWRTPHQRIGSIIALKPNHRHKPLGCDVPPPLPDPDPPQLQSAVNSARVRISPRLAKLLLGHNPTPLILPRAMSFLGLRFATMAASFSYPWGSQVNRAEPRPVATHSLFDGAKREAFKFKSRRSIVET